MGRWSFLGFQPAGGDTARPRRAPRPLRARGRGARALPDRAARGAAAVRRRRGRAVRLRPRAHGRADRRRAEPRRHRAARAGADDHRRAAGVRPPSPRGHGAGERGLRGTTLERSYEEAAAAIAEVRERLRGPVPPPSGAAASRPSSSRTWAPRATPPPSSGRRSTSAPATSTRWCRASAGAPTARSTPSRSIAGCARSTRARTCTSSTSRTSRSPGASPESLVKVTGRRVEQRPIAGTRPRAGSAEQDLERARELLADEKERAEHVMLVDLGRNDLGRVCEYGSVAVDELMAMETYSHVIHIVSAVSGTLREGVTADGRAARLAAGGHAVRRAEDPRDADHRRARAGEARPPTAAPWATSPTPATSTPASTSARRSSRTAACTSRPAAASWPTPIPTTRCARPRRRRDAVFEAIRLACAQGDWA